MPLPTIHAQRLKDLQERRIGVDPVAETHGSTGDLDIAGELRRIYGGGIAIMCILFFFPIVFLSCFPLSPFTYSLAHLSHLLCLTSVGNSVLCRQVLRSHTSNRTRAAQGS